MTKGVKNIVPNLCKEDGCEGIVKGHGMCKKHWRLWRRENGALCSIDGCGRGLDAKGLCSAHYQRLSKHGDPLAQFEVSSDQKNNWKFGSPALRFFVNLDWRDLTEDSCWIWAGACQKGYPMLSDQNQKAGYRTTAAHRFAYDRWVADIPDGWHVDHLCGNRDCVNPNHLEAVPKQINILRGMADSVRELYGEELLAKELEWLASVARDKQRKSAGVWDGIAEEVSGRLRVSVEELPEVAEGPQR